MGAAPPSLVVKRRAVRLKQKPEDFSVKESYRFDEDPEGRYRVYLMDKQKLSTFEAVERIRTRFGLRPGAISYCGLKDKQGRTEQLIAVDGAEVEHAGPRPAPQAPGPHRPPALRPQHHLQPLRGHGARSHRGGPCRTCHWPRPR